LIGREFETDPFHDRWMPGGGLIIIRRITGKWEIKEYNLNMIEDFKDMA
jgi:hypothetical protein